MDTISSNQIIATCAVLTVIYTLFYFLFSKLFCDKNTLNRLKEYLEDNNPLEWYHDVIRQLLETAETFFGMPWSIRAYIMIFLIALIYPILFMLFGYLMSGHYLMGVRLAPIFRPLS